jgi:acetyl-CoA acetyltransferase
VSRPSLCGSGLQAIVSAAQAVRLGDCDAAVAGGAESMSRGRYWLPSMRWGQRMQDGVAVDAMVGALTDPFDSCHMGVTAENVASDYGVSSRTGMRWRRKATGGPPRPPKPGTSRSRSCRSR